MKSLAVLLVAILLVGGFAVGGSRAQPLPAVSIAAQQCQSGAPGGAACRPLTGSLALALEQDNLLGERAEAGSVGGDSVSEPDWHWQELIARLVFEAATWFAEHFGGLYAPEGAPINPETIFDAR